MRRAQRRLRLRSAADKQRLCHVRPVFGILSIDHNRLLRCGNRMIQIQIFKQDRILLTRNRIYGGQAIIACNFYRTPIPRFLEYRYLFSKAARIAVADTQNHAPAAFAIGEDRFSGRHFDDVGTGAGIEVIHPILRPCFIIVHRFRPGGVRMDNGNTETLVGHL